MIRSAVRTELRGDFGETRWFTLGGGDGTTDLPLELNEARMASFQLPVQAFVWVGQHLTPILTFLSWPSCLWMAAGAAGEEAVGGPRVADRAAVRADATRHPEGQVRRDHESPTDTTHHL